MQDRTTKYAKEVLAGNIVAGKYVKLACERHMNDLKKSKKKSYPYIFDVEKAEAHLSFFNLCNHYKGDCANTPIQLSLWQCFVQGSVFGWVHKDTGLRRFREVYEQVARKNGKSTKAAATGLYCLAVDGESGAEVYSAATTRDQAKIIFETAQEMIRRSPAISKYLNVLTNNINMPSTASKFNAVSSEAKTLDGLNIHCGLIDELHAHPSRKVYDVLKSARGSRKQPLIWVVTTAGEITNGICKERYDYSKKVLEGVHTNDALFIYIAQLDEGDDPFDEKNWIKANPNLGISVSVEDLRTNAKEARDIPAAYNNFLCKHMNMWVTSFSSWINMQKWNDCDKELPDLTGKSCYCGVDLANKIDLASVTFEFPLPGGEYAVINHSFIPENRVYELEHRDNAEYSAWIRQGYITATPGDVIDFNWIEEYIKNAALKYNILEIDYDPYSATQFACNMTNEGFTCVEIRQGYRTLSEPTKDMQKLIIDKKLIHGNNPVLTWAVSNAISVRDPAGNEKLDKEKSKMKIDPIAATITSHVRAMINPNVDFNSHILNDKWSL